MNVITKLIDVFKKDATVTPQVLMDMEGMAKRNADRIEAIKAEMGEKYAHAKINYVERLKEPRPV